MDARTDTIRDVLALAQTTSLAWITAALDALDVILLDHAHCEKKAASTAVGFLFRYPERTSMAQVMSRLAREELVHFERVLGELGRRGIAFRRMPPSPYGAKLYKQVRSWQPAKLMDELLVSALIEARSCERFELLAEVVKDPALEALYRDLGPAEERHTELYVELACEVAPRAEVMDRARFLAEKEAEIVAAPGAALRLHAG
jgi:tRNA-(ms[2]io[6]A)-hydroxylase